MPTAMTHSAVASQSSTAAIVSVVVKTVTTSLRSTAAGYILVADCICLSPSCLGSSKSAFFEQNSISVEQSLLQSFFVSKLPAAGEVVV